MSGGAGGDAGLEGLALGEPGLERLSVPLGLRWGPLGTLPVLGTLRDPAPVTFWHTG